MMDDYNTHLRHGINYMRRNEETITASGHATDLFTEWALEFIRSYSSSERRQAADRKQPFFLELAFNAPHGPIQPPADWLRRVREREPQLSDLQARRVALVEHMDAGIGRALEALTGAVLERDTLVVFTSDNGGPTYDGAINIPLRDGKGSMYDGGLRVPFAARWPGHIAPNRQPTFPLSRWTSFRRFWTPSVLPFPKTSTESVFCPHCWAKVRP